jgi:GNAT superfamily N-acetyltransferase
VPNDNRFIEIRPAWPDDEAFVLATTERLGAFPVPAWRTPAEIAAGEVRTLAAHFRAPLADAALLLAVDGEGRRLGFVFLEARQDYFTLARHAHVATLAVTGESEGSGVGRALLEASERWAHEQGFTMLTLNVFESNLRARSLYEHLGYRPETLHYVKMLEGHGRR